MYIYTSVRAHARTHTIQIYVMIYNHSSVIEKLYVCLFVFYLIQYD